MVRRVRRGDLMVSPLYSRLSGLGPSPGRDHCQCVLGQDTLMSSLFLFLIFLGREKAKRRCDHRAASIIITFPLAPRI